MKVYSIVRIHKNSNTLYNLALGLEYGPLIDFQPIKPFNHDITKEKISAANLSKS